MRLFRRAARPCARGVTALLFAVVLCVPSVGLADADDDDNKKDKRSVVAVVVNAEDKRESDSDARKSDEDDEHDEDSDDERDDASKDDRNDDGGDGEGKDDAKRDAEDDKDERESDKDRNETSDGTNQQESGDDREKDDGDKREDATRSDGEKPAGATPPAATSSDKVDGALARVAAEALAKDPHTPLRVIVFGPGANAASARVDADLRRGLGSSGAVSVSVEAQDLARLAADAGVRYLIPDLPVLPTSGASSGRVDAPSPGLRALFPSLDGAPAAWKRGLTGRGVGIAVIDSGVAARPEFGRRLVQVALPGASTDDTYGHGTFVAGIAAAGLGGDRQYMGIAPGAKIFGINVAKSDGVYSSDVIAGLEWVLDNSKKHNIRVVTLALSEVSPSSYLTSALDTTVERLWRAGIVVVASAGNLGHGAAVFAPANDPHIITVGALDANGTPERADDFVAAFSSRGNTLDGFAKPELLAPGRRIASTLPVGSALHVEAPDANRVAPGYATMSGTSFSAPQAAAAAAILLQQHPHWTPDQVKWLLTKVARPVAGSEAGTLDIAAAVRFKGRPRSANIGITRASFGVEGATTESFHELLDSNGDKAWDAASWNAASWNAASWNAASWNAASWNAASWNAASWNAASWNAASWS